MGRTFLYLQLNRQLEVLVQEYYDQPGKRAESGSYTEAYATDEGKRITHQLWQEAMGNNYQNVSALLDNQSIVSASQVAGGPF